MRKTNELIELLFQIYTSRKWQEMEEYFEVAYALLMFHGAKFKMLDDVKDVAIKSLGSSNGYFTDVDKYMYVSQRMRMGMKEDFDSLCDNDEELKRLNKLNDSEDGFREDINAGPDNLEYFTSICHKFITFKY